MLADYTISSLVNVAAIRSGIAPLTYGRFPLSDNVYFRSPSAAPCEGGAHRPQEVVDGDGTVTAVVGHRTAVE